MKLTISMRFVALSTLVVAIIFALFNAFVYFEFMNVTIEREEQVLSARSADMARRMQGDTLAAALAQLRATEPDPREMIRLATVQGHVRGASAVQFSPSWIPESNWRHTEISGGVALYRRQHERILVVNTDIHLKNGVYRLQWLENVAVLDHSTAIVFYLLLTGSIGGLVLAAVASYFLARYSLLPIREMIAATRAITPGDLRTRIDVPKRQDELTELGHTFNDMLDRLSHAFLRERRFVADASHELRTPLAVLEGYIDLLRRWGWDDEALRKEAVGAIEEEVRHLRGMTNQLLALASLEADDGADACADAGVAVRRVTERWMRLYTGHRWEVAVASDRSLVAAVSEARLEQVLRALLDNARKYTPQGGSIRVVAERAGEFVRLAVSDTGPGIADEDIAHVTERFYRADKARTRQEGGAGLGLAICREIVEAAEGRLAVRRSPDGGAEVEVMLRFAGEE